MKTIHQTRHVLGAWLAASVLAGWWPGMSATAVAPISAEVGPFIVDRTPPTTPVRVAPTDGGTLVSGTVALKVAASDATTQVAGYCFRLGDESLGWQPQATSVLTGLAEGSYAWQCCCRDVAGNESGWSPWFTFTVKAAGGGDSGSGGDDGSGSGGEGSGEDGDSGLTDSDGDHLPDSWEFAFFRRLDYTAGGEQDSDEDGVCDADEYQAATHPFAFKLTLRPGWNLLAFPFDLGRDSVQNLQNAAGITFWAWNGSSYVRVMSVRAFQGIMVYSGIAVPELTVCGFPPAANRVTLVPGWNLVGPGFTARLADPAPAPAIWQLGNRGQYILLDPTVPNLRLQPLTGYWMFSPGGDLDFVRLPALDLYRERAKDIE